MQLDGVLVIDKPAGKTSHDVVDRVRDVFKTRKVGHGGTLDPDATGVLLVGIGRATRLLAYAQAGPKRYRATARFGVTTSTQDSSGDVLKERPVRLSREVIEHALASFRGEIDQIPPMVSAVRMGGERLYEKARRGEEVERRPRRVTIHSLDLVDFDGVDRATFDVACSSGTYVRTLIADLGETLGCGAHLEDLRRTQAGGFTDEDAIPLDELRVEALRPLVDAVGDLPRVEVDAKDAERVAHGQSLDVANGPKEGRFVAVVRDGNLLAVYVREGRRWVADRVLA
ncbi:MAG: tRNA pseudouridine(55) synthase TruB [Actinomycetota bacterium]